MAWFLVVTATWVGWILLARRRSVEGLQKDWRESAAIVALLASPLLLAALTLASREGSDHVAFDYHGKRIDLRRQAAIVGRTAEADLRHGDIGGKVRIDATPAGPAFAPVAGPLPILRVDGRYPQAVRLRDGDWLVLRKPGRDLGCLHFRTGLLNDSLRAYAGTDCEAALDPSRAPPPAAAASTRLPSRARTLLTSGSRVVLLRDVACDGVPCPDDAMLSAVFRPTALSRWHLLVRDLWSATPPADGDRDARGILLVRPTDAGAPEISAPGHRTWTAPPSARLDSRVARGPAGRRRLETVRSDRLRLEDERLDIRFSDPRRIILPKPENDRGHDDASRRGDFLILPGDDTLGDRALEASLQTVSFGEQSERFRHLSVIARLARNDQVVLAVRDASEAGLAVDEGDPFLLGIDEGLLLTVRQLDRWGVVFIPGLVTATLGLCFMFNAARFSLAFAALLTGVGQLLTLRGLFAYRVSLEGLAAGPGAFRDALLGALLIPAVLYAGWLIGVGARGGGRGAVATARAVLPLLVASLCSLWLAGPTPLAAIPLLAALPTAWLLARPGAAIPSRLRRRLTTPLVRLTAWTRGRLATPVTISVLIAGLLAVARLAGIVAGMPERVRFAGLRLSWSVLQVPVCIVLIAWLIHHTLGAIEAVDRGDGRLRAVWQGIGAIGFVGVVDFLLVGIATADLGLVVVHGMPLAIAILLLARPLLQWTRTSDVRRRTTAIGLLVLLAVPAAALLLIQLFPPLFILASDAESDLSYRAYRILALTDPERLATIGVRDSDAMGLLSRTMRAFAADGGWLGDGFLSSEIPRYLGRTYLNDLVPMTFVLPEFGKAGMLSVALIYLLVLAGMFPREPGAGDGRAAFGQILATVSLISFTGASVYMLAANVGQTLLSGKNCYLLALDSRSDLLESALLLALAAFGFALRRRIP